MRWRPDRISPTATANLTALSNLEQTAFVSSNINNASRSDWRGGTVLYICRVPHVGLEKLAEADRDERHRRRLITAAEGWLFLASQLRRVEKTFEKRTTRIKGHPE